MGRAPEREDPTIRQPPSERITPGTLLAGRYIIERTLGQGGMGTVFSAMDTVLEERVGLKLMRRSLAEDPEAVARFHREVRLARRVTHHNVARTFDIGDGAGRPFLTMELIEGESLSARLRRVGALAFETVVTIGRQVCDALAAAHDSGVIHRDLKPANILIDPHGRAVVTDFGIAHRVHRGDAATRTDSLVLGTPDYMAPEQLAGSAPTPKTDLFALGVTLYEMATGHHPCKSSSPTRSASEPSSTEHPLPPALLDVIHWCMHDDPRRRPASARVVASALDRMSRHERPSADSGQARADAGEFAPVEPGHHALAILPLRYHGPAQDAYLAEAMTEHLVDLLSMTQGLRMSGLGATAHFVDQRDPRELGRALGVETVIDGTLHRAGPRLRVTIRMLEANSGRQTWCETFDGELRDVFELHDHIATQIAEALRLRLERVDYEFTASAEAVELFMRARLHLTLILGEGIEHRAAADALERCLALAPGFPPAVASLALAYAGLWFVYRPEHDERDWPSLCRAAVATALRDAPRLPETHLAAARMHGQQGDFLGAARALARALELAPTHAATHAMLGTLQCEAGLGDEGRRHIELAVELDPRDLSPLFEVARHHILRGEHERFEATVERLWARAPRMQPLVAVLRMRVAIWAGDHDQIRRWRDVLRHTASSGLRFVQELARYVLEEIELEAVQAAFEAQFPADVSPRRRAVNHQAFVEALMARGEHALAIEHLDELAQTMLVDIDWLECCPLLDPLRGQPALAAIEGTVRARAQAIWSIG